MPTQAKVAELLELADRMRRTGGASRDILREQVALAQARGLIDMDQATVVYRHLAIHAGAIQPTSVLRYHFCPECEAYLDRPEDT